MSRLVVLNKIDTLWDALSTPAAQVQAQIDRQCATRRNSGLPREQVIPVSAQKGWWPRSPTTPALLAASLPAGAGACAGQRHHGPAPEDPARGQWPVFRACAQEASRA
jgi:hypothetical protein